MAVQDVPVRIYDTSIDKWYCQNFQQNTRTWLNKYFCNLLGWLCYRDSCIYALCKTIMKHFI